MISVIIIIQDAITFWVLFVKTYLDRHGMGVRVGVMVYMLYRTAIVVILKIGAVK